jgi:crossover junction endodeoxyribonuclease RusA
MTMTFPASWFIRGIPVTQGSMRAMVSPKGRAFCRPQNALGLAQWRADIAAAVLADLSTPLADWFRLDLEFRFPRPPSHYTKKGAIKKGAPWRPRKDLDKLLRATFDALTGVLYRDDYQVCEGSQTKIYVNDGAQGLLIRAMLLTDPYKEDDHEHRELFDRYAGRSGGGRSESD